MSLGSRSSTLAVKPIASLNGTVFGNDSAKPPCARSAGTRRCAGSCAGTARSARVVVERILDAGDHPVEVVLVAGVVVDLDRDVAVGTVPRRRV